MSTGVPKSTLSRVVDGEPRVGAAVAERIRDAVTELGHVPDQAPRSLVSRRDNAVAVVVGEPQNRLFVGPPSTAFSGASGRDSFEWAPAVNTGSAARRDSRSGAATTEGAEERLRGGPVRP
ncbi:hypothetical protein SALBM135S_08435 [Streptomyces alboniger]